MEIKSTTAGIGHNSAAREAARLTDYLAMIRLQGDPAQHRGTRLDSWLAAICQSAISIPAMLVAARIKALSFKHGHCWATRQDIATDLQLSIRSVGDILTSLEAAGAIHVVAPIAGLNLPKEALDVRRRWWVPNVGYAGARPNEVLARHVSEVVRAMIRRPPDVDVCQSAIEALRSAWREVHGVDPVFDAAVDAMSAAIETKMQAPIEANPASIQDGMKANPASIASPTKANSASIEEERGQNLPSFSADFALISDAPYKRTRASNLKEARVEKKEADDDGVADARKVSAPTKGPNSQGAPSGSKSSARVAADATQPQPEMALGDMWFEGRHLRIPNATFEMWCQDYAGFRDRPDMVRSAATGCDAKCSAGGMNKNFATALDWFGANWLPNARTQITAALAKIAPVNSHHRPTPRKSALDGFDPTDFLKDT